MEILDELALKMKSPGNRHLVGQIGVDAIRDHLVKGDGFQTLSAVTKEYRGTNAKPLRDTGSLQESINYRLDGEEDIVLASGNKIAAVQNDGMTIRAKKEWLFIPAGSKTRTLMRRYGYSPKEVLSGLRSDGYSVFRMGRTVCYRSKTKIDGAYKNTVVYYLKKEVVIPARRFFYLGIGDIQTIFAELELI